MSNNPQQPYYINRDTPNVTGTAYPIPINVNTTMIPGSMPTFTYTEENFDLDFGLLSEYIAEDQGTGGLVSRTSSQNNYYSHSQPISCVTSDNGQFYVIKLILFNTLYSIQIIVQMKMENVRDHRKERAKIS